LLFIFIFDTILEWLVSCFIKRLNINNLNIMYAVEFDTLIKDKFIEIPDYKKFQSQNVNKHIAKREEIYDR